MVSGFDWMHMLNFMICDFDHSSSLTQTPALFKRKDEAIMLHLNSCVPGIVGEYEVEIWDGDHLARLVNSYKWNGQNLRLLEPQSFSFAKEFQ